MLSKVHILCGRVWVNACIAANLASLHTRSSEKLCLNSIIVATDLNSRFSIQLQKECRGYMNV